MCLWSFLVLTFLLSLCFFRLILASKTYHHALSKKKKANEIFIEDEKLLPIDILGLVMMRHGEQFGGDSTFGSFHTLGYLTVVNLSDFVVA